MVNNKSIVRKEFVDMYNPTLINLKTELPKDEDI